MNSLISALFSVSLSSSGKNSKKEHAESCVSVDHTASTKGGRESRRVTETHICGHRSPQVEQCGFPPESHLLPGLPEVPDLCIDHVKYTCMLCFFCLLDDKAKECGGLPHLSEGAVIRVQAFDTKSQCKK